MIYNVQALRAVAAIMVVFFHLYELSNTLGIPAIGLSGLDLFFVISGFIMVHTTKNNPPPPIQFLLNRIARVVPIYWIMTLVVFGIALAAPHLLGATTASGIQLIKSLLFIPFMKSNGQIRPVLFVGWTLNYEMFFYAMFAISLTVKNYKIGIIALAASLSTICVIGNLTHPHGIIIKFYTDPIILEFVLGMGVAFITDIVPHKVEIKIKILMLLTLLSIPFLFLAPVMLPATPRLISCGGASVILLAGAVLLERWKWRIQSATIILVGDASYSLYLSHPYVVQIFQKFGMLLNPSGLLSIMMIIFCIVIAVMAAIIIHVNIEKPAFRAVRRILMVDRLRPQPA